LARIDSTTVSAAAGDLAAALRRAASLLAQTDLEHREIHLISDAQRSAFPGDGPLAVDALPVLLFDGRPAAPPNLRALGWPLVGGGLPPLAAQRTDVVVDVRAWGEAAADTAGSPVRVFAGGRIRAVGAARPGTQAVLGVGPFPAGPLTGWVETDADALAVDDRRYFALEVRPPPAVRITGPAPLFLQEAVDVLVDAGRMRRAEGAAAADVVFAVAGRGAPATGAVIFVPARDPALLPALNGALQRRGVGWRLEAAASAGARTVSDAPGLPPSLADVRVVEAYRLVAPAGAGPESGRVLARLDDGSPWVVAGLDEAGPWMLLASPLDAGSSNLPVSAAMIPFVEWAAAGFRSDAGGAASLAAGEPLPTPPGATAVRDPAGTVHAVDGTLGLVGTREAGIYEVLQGDRVVAVRAVNAPEQESDPAPVDAERLAARLAPAPLSVTADSARWARTVFVARRGREVWRVLVALALVLLVAESLLAAAGREARGRDGDTADA
ncbi:MAG: hypothetical protein D6701_07205, partial [Gemmatimonadetes bacterium]